MKIWFFCVAAITVMTATLSLVSSDSIPAVQNYVSYILLFIALAMIFVIVINDRWQFFVIKPTWLRKSVTILSTLLIAGLGLMAAMMHTITVFQNSAAQQIQHEQIITATLDVTQLSDSVSPYRQMVKVDSIQPLRLHKPKNDVAHASISNPFNNLFLTPDNSASNTSTSQTDVAIKHQLNDLVGKTLLLSDSSNHITEAQQSQLKPNEQLTATIHIKPLPKNAQHLVNNTSGFNVYRWLKSRQIDGQAELLNIWQITSNQQVDTSLNTWLQQQRWQIRRHFAEHVLNDKTGLKQQAAAVTLSLLTGDRAYINKETTQLYQLAGISHLLAISGTHVLFLAVLLGFVFTSILNRIYPQIYRLLPRWQCAWLVMLMGALIYALFTGFDVPAQRTVWMLFAVGVARILMLPISSHNILLMVAVCMAWCNPFILWQAGFWLSFFAMFLLISYEDKSNSVSHVAMNSQIVDEYTSWLHKLGHSIWLMVKLQSWMFLGLLPISLLLFGKVSIYGLLINLFAIGFFGWIVVPFNLLAGVLFWLLPSLADAVWWLVIQMLSGLHGLLDFYLNSSKGFLQQLPWLYWSVNFGVVFIAVCIALPWILPKSLLNRWYALPAGMLLMMVFYNQNFGIQTQPRLVVLNKIDGTLDTNIFSYQNQHWLIVSDASYQGHTSHSISQAKSLTFNHHHIDGAKLSQMWQEQLNKYHINELAGIVIQSPSNILNNAAQRLQKAITIQQIWTADYQHYKKQSNEAYHQISEENINPIIKKCQPETNWSSADGVINIKALTGWQDLPNNRFWQCTVNIDGIKSQQNINIIHHPKVVADVSKTQVKMVTDINRMAVNEVFISHVNGDELWQLNQLMCMDDNVMPYDVNNTTTNHVLITDSYSTEPYHKPWQYVILSDNLSDSVNTTSDIKIQQKLQDYVKVFQQN